VEKYGITVDKPLLLWITSFVKNDSLARYGGNICQQANIWAWVTVENCLLTVDKPLLLGITPPSRDIRAVL